jgi:regulatory protein
MPIITAITQQKRTTTRFSLYLDDKYAFAMSDLELSTSGLRVGQELTSQEVQAWEQQSLENKAHHLALGYLSYRPRSQREVEDYLRGKDYEPDLVAIVTARLERAGLINDAEFAAAWIRHRQSLRPRSRRALEAELLQKGLGRDIIATALAELGEEGQEDMLVDLIGKRRRQTRYQQPDKLMQYLARQGFSYDQIKKALARLDD